MRLHKPEWSFPRNVDRLGQPFSPGEVTDLLACDYAHDYIDLVNQVERSALLGESIDLTLEEKKVVIVLLQRLGWVYFLAAPSAGVIKIGKTGNVEQRMATLATQSPVPLKFIVALRAPDEMEGNIHLYLDAFRSHGEWFNAEPPVIEFVRRARDRGFESAFKTLEELDSVETLSQN